MKLKQYQINANRTCPSLGTEAIDLAHMVLGLVSEQEELIKADIKKDKVGQGEEIADQFWYLSNYCTIRNYDLEKLWENKYDYKIEDWEEESDIFTVHISKLQDYVKKYLAYGKQINRDKEENSLIIILNGLDAIINMYEVNLEDVLEKNISKLRQRFPEKFDSNLAINRNVEKERKILEGKNN